jgi:hypothetical protein
VYPVTPLPVIGDRAEEKNNPLIRTLGALIVTRLTKRLLPTVTITVYPRTLKSTVVGVHFSNLL